MNTKMLTFLFAILTLSCLTYAKYEIVDITIPNTVWDGVKSVMCTAYPVKANRYIKMFYPLRPKHTIHHVSAALCDTPHSTEKYWECKPSNLTCGSGDVANIWAVSKDGPAWNLSKDLAVPTGSRDGYIVVQVHAPPHMTLPSTPGFFATGLRLNITDHKPKYFSGLAGYVNMGYIPASTTGFTADTACVWSYENNPVFGVSIHSHGMATAIAGYIYRNGKYIEFVRGDPVYPEPIIDISERNIVLKKGDIVLMRCTLTNPRDTNVYFGSRHEDEMCNFYIYYGILPANYQTHTPFICGKDAQSFHWNLANSPKNSTLPDKEGYAKLMARFHLEKAEY